MNVIEINNELVSAMRKFEEVFGDVVPLRELPQNISNEEIISVINESIEKKVNKLPTLFDYKKLEKNKNILV